MSEQEARETACAIFGGNGDFYSFRKKPHNNTGTTTNTTITQPVGFTESQIKKIIEIANGRNVNFYVGKEIYFLKTHKVKIEDGLFYAYNKEINAVVIYPLGMIHHMKIFEK